MPKLKAGKRYEYTWEEYRANGRDGPIHVPEQTATYTVNRIEGRKVYITWANGSSDHFTIACPIALGSRELDD